MKKTLEETTFIVFFSRKVFHQHNNLLQEDSGEEFYNEVIAWFRSVGCLANTTPYSLIATCELPPPKMQ